MLKLVRLFLVVISVESLPTPPEFGARIFLDNVGFIDDYSQMESQSIFGDRGLWCLGSNQASGLYWSLPDGMQLLQRNATYSEYGIKTVSWNNAATGFALGLFATNRGLLAEGVFQCVVLDLPREGSFTTISIWITKDLHPPQEKASVCQLNALLIFANTTAVLVHSNIIQGPPTTVSCELANTNSGNLQIIGDFRSIENKQGVTETGVTVGLYISISSYPSKVVCTYGNSAGSTSFACLLRESELSYPIITSITRNNATSATVEWENVSELDLFAHYTVFKQSPDGSFFKTSTLQSQLTCFDTSFNLTAYENIFVAAYSPVFSNNVVILPAISREDKVFRQCHPVESYQIGIRVISYNRGKMLSTISDVESNVTDFVRREILFSEYWSVDVRGVSLQEKTKTGRQRTTSKLNTENSTQTTRTSETPDEPNEQTETKKNEAQNESSKSGTKRQENVMTEKSKGTKKSKKKENTKEKSKKEEVTGHSSRKKEKSKKSKGKKPKTPKKTKKKGKIKAKHRRNLSDPVIDISQLNYIDFSLLVYSNNPCQPSTTSGRIRRGTHRTQTRSRNSRHFKNHMKKYSKNEQPHTKRSTEAMSKTRTHTHSAPRTVSNRNRNSNILNIRGGEHLTAVITEETDSEFYCGEHIVTSTDTCDCPEYC